MELTGNTVLDYPRVLELTKQGVEIWKDIVGYEGCYQVSNFGRIKSLLSLGRIIKLQNGAHYKQVSLYFNKLQKTWLVHRLVGIMFIPTKSIQLTINHIDENKFNNILTNLEWLTIKQNVQHSIKKWTKPGKHGNSKLLESEVLEIRNLYQNSSESIYSLGYKFKVSANTIYQIIIKNTWKHI